jgi:hypothetical protein
MDFIDIHSKGKYSPDDNTKKIAIELSNFTEHHFTLDGVECASMEGFLQSLKYLCPKKQREICKLTGKVAKEAGDGKKLWKLTQTAVWQGKCYDRLSPEFRELIFRAYSAMYEQNAPFREALAASRGAKLCHSIGEPNPKKTILTEREFICMLYRLRNYR